MQRIPGSGITRTATSRTTPMTRTRLRVGYRPHSDLATTLATTPARPWSDTARTATWQTGSMIAIVCPGQGSQTPGFLTPWLAEARFADSLAELSDAAGIDLTTHGTVSDADTIRDTAVAQPLIISAAKLTPPPPPSSPRPASPRRAQPHRRYCWAFGGRVHSRRWCRCSQPGRCYARCRGAWPSDGGCLGTDSHRHECCAQYRQGIGAGTTCRTRSRACQYQRRWPDRCCRSHPGPHDAERGASDGSPGDSAAGCRGFSHPVYVIGRAGACRRTHRGCGP